VRKGNLHKFGGHSHGGSNQHPEQGRRPAQMNGQCNPGNVSGANRSRECSRQRLKMGSVAHIAFFIKFTAYYPDCIFQVPELRKFQINGEKDTSAQ
jgi:hypothetical protein